MFGKGLCAPISAFVLTSLGGLLLHIRVHPPTADASNWIPVVFGAISIVVLPFLFSTSKTVAWAYLLTVLTVVAGTVGMAYESISHWQTSVTLTNILLYSTLADILILWAKLPLAHVILRHWRPASAAQTKAAA